jgi:hypothetical protein
MGQIVEIEVLDDLHDMDALVSSKITKAKEIDMEIGTGIAILGVWVFCGMTSAAEEVTSIGMKQTWLLAVVMTGILIFC